MPFRSLVVTLALLLSAAAQAESPVAYLQGGFRFGASIPTQTATSTEAEESPAWGLLLQFPSASDTAIELYASNGRSLVNIAGQPQLAISHVQLGGIKYVEMGSTRSFVGASVGFSYLRLDGRDDTFRPAYALYGGFEWPLGEHFSLRAEARWLGVYFDSPTRLQCAGNCALDIGRGTLSQVEGVVGVGIRFP